jgi:hypothetical protein
VKRERERERVKTDSIESTEGPIELGLETSAIELL